MGLWGEVLEAGTIEEGAKWLDPGGFGRLGQQGVWNEEENSGYSRLLKPRNWVKLQFTIFPPTHIYLSTYHERDCCTTDSPKNVCPFYFIPC